MKVGNSDIKNILIGENPIVKIYKGLEVVWKRNELPDGYRQVAYLESTGTQYINTGFIPSSNTKVEVQFKNITRIYPAGLFGSRNTIGVKEFAVFINEASTNYFRFDYSGTTLDHRTTNGSVSDMNTLYTIIKDREKNYINGARNNANASTTFTGEYPIFLCGINTGGTGVTGKSAIQLFYCKIWDNDTLVRDLIPCLDENNTPCLYDKVTQRTFYNAGTGQFLYGEIN